MKFDMKIRFKSRTPSIEEVMEVAEKYASHSMCETNPITDPAAMGRYLKLKLAQLEHEVFGVLFLNNRHMVIAYEEMFRGTVDGASVHPREVVKRALELNACALVFAHNHPSGDPEPSAADRAITMRLRDALMLVDIRVLDHVVVGKGRTVSLAQRGWI